MTTLLKYLLSAVLGGLANLAALFTVYLKGESAGENKEKAKVANATLSKMEEIDETCQKIQDNLDSMSDSDVIDGL